MEKKCSPKEIREGKCIKEESLSRNSMHILADLYKAKRPLPVREIAKRNDISWKTAKDHIEKLKERDLIECDKTKRRNYCIVSKKFLKSLEE